MTDTQAKQPLFLPKLWTCLQSYSPRLFWGDLASGVPPERGLITAIVAGFLISALGGSRVQIGGPTGAFVVIVFHIVQQYGLDGLLACTLTVGFTAGIAVVIFSSQIKDFLGLTTGPLSGDTVRNRLTVACGIGTRSTRRR